jgi:putative transposase
MGKPKKLMGVQQNLLKPDQALRAILEYICSESNKLHNCAVYYARQMYFKNKHYVTPFDLNYELLKNRHFAALCAQAAQQTCGAVGEAVKSFSELIKLFWSGDLTDKPKFPKYRKPGLHLVAYPKQALKLIDGLVRFPLGLQTKAWFDLAEFYLPFPSNLDWDDIREVRILPRNSAFYAEFVYPTVMVKAEVDPDKVLGVDPGLDNWATCISNVGTSFIIDGLHLKSINQWYNKTVAKLMEGQPNGYWSKRLARATEKRNRVMRDAVNKAAKKIVDHCLAHGIGTLVFGWNDGQKDGANLGSKMNQKYVQIPHAKLKERVKQLCAKHGIRFIQTEESYTSKASFVDADEIPVYGEKPMDWEPSGRRIKRGLYRTGNEWWINADCNGAANIIRKVAAMLGLDLSGVSRGALSAPVRVPLWN